jgi:hypothetical protein
VRRVLLICVLALAFASPAFGADIYVSNNSSLPQEQLADALPTFQQALDEDFAPTWREASGSRLILGKAPQRAGRFESPTRSRSAASAPAAALQDARIETGYCLVTYQEVERRR